jgi:hypothetical protein
MVVTTSADRSPGLLRQSGAQSAWMTGIVVEK